MCNFFAFLGFRNGDFFHAAEVTNNHEPLIRAAKVRDSQVAQMAGYFFRGEFTPPADLKTLSDFSTWGLKVDEDQIPYWYDEIKTREWCERQVAPMFIRDARETILGGCWILDGKGASIKELVHGKIDIVANGASLDGASLDRASLDRARLDGASLVDASLDRASLVGARLDRAYIQAGAWLPKGWKRTDAGIVVKDES